MVIETTRKITKAEAKEVTNMLYNARKLIKDPARKLTDMFRFCTVSAGLCVMSLLLFLSFLARGDRDVMTLTGVIITVIAIIFDVAFYMGIRKTYQTLLEKNHEKVVVTFDQKGMVYEAFEAQGNTRMETSWANVAFGRAFKEMVGFFPKDITGLIVSVSKEHYDEIRKFIEENQIEVRIVEEKRA